MIAAAFVEIRLLGWHGKAQQAGDLADAFHNVAREMHGWGRWNQSTFRGRLEDYQRKYRGEDHAGGRDYLKMFDAIFGLRQAHPIPRISAEVKPDGRRNLMRGFAQAAAERGQHFFYVLIRESLGPAERVEKYEGPLNDALGDLGEVTGGGSQLGESGAIAYCGLDVVVNHRDRGLKVIRECLRTLGAPANTIIEEYLPEFAELQL